MAHRNMYHWLPKLRGVEKCFCYRCNKQIIATKKEKFCDECQEYMVKVELVAPVSNSKDYLRTTGKYDKDSSNPNSATFGGNVTFEIPSSADYRKPKTVYVLPQGPNTTSFTWGWNTDRWAQTKTTQPEPIKKEEGFIDTTCHLDMATGYTHKFF